MKLAKRYKTATYETGVENFLLDVVEHPETFINGETKTYYTGYLYRENMSVKDMVVGIAKEPGDTIRTAAKKLIDYCCIDWGKGDSFDFYDEQYN